MALLLTDRMLHILLMLVKVDYASSPVISGFKKLRRQNNLISWYLNNAQLLKKLLSIQEGEHFIWTFVGQFGSAIRINVIHGEVNL